MEISEFVVHTQLDPPAGWLVVSGELDAFTASQLSRQVSGALAAGCTSMSIDLSGVSFVDAGGVRALLQARAWSDAGAALELVAPSGCIRRLSGILGLDSALGIG